MTVRRSSLALLGLLLAGPVVWAALHRAAQHQEALALVREAATAHRRVDYAGDIAWRRARWSNGSHVENDADSGFTRYTWSKRSKASMDSKGWSKGPNGGRPWSYVTSGPNTRSADPAAWCLDADAVARNYDVTEEEGPVFLNRPTRQLVLTPRHEGRPSMRLTLDAETRLPLKVVNYLPDGSLYRVRAFRSLEIAPQEVHAAGRERFPKRRDWFGTSVPVSRVDEHLAFDALMPDYLPEGFDLIECRVSGRTLHRLRLVYTDGLTVFELVQALIPTPAQLETEYTRLYGRRAAQRHLAWYRWRCVEGIVRSEGGGGTAAGGDSVGDSVGGDGATTVHRRERGSHRFYSLKVGNVEVQLTCRADLSEEESLRVLRSLRAR